jgi:hypothetical protein
MSAEDFENYCKDCKMQSDVLEIFRASIRTSEEILSA